MFARKLMCPVCHRKYANNFTLTRHIKNFHPDFINKAKRRKLNSSGSSSKGKSYEGSGKFKIAKFNIYKTFYLIASSSSEKESETSEESEQSEQSEGSEDGEDSEAAGGSDSSEKSSGSSEKVTDSSSTDADTDASTTSSRSTSGNSDSSSQVGGGNPDSGNSSVDSGSASDGSGSNQESQSETDDESGDRKLTDGEIQNLLGIVSTAQKGGVKADKHAFLVNIMKQTDDVDITPYRSIGFYSYDALNVIESILDAAQLRTMELTTKLFKSILSSLKINRYS